MPENSRFEPVMKEGSNQLLLVDIHIQNTAPLWKVISQTMGGSAVSLKWVLHNNTLLRNRQKNEERFAQNGSVERTTSF